MDVGIVLLKGLVGGTLVVLFALVGEVVRPRRLAGITSAGPSVAAAGLLVTLLTSGATRIMRRPRARSECLRRLGFRLSRRS
jgi:hypothetical protein